VAFVTARRTAQDVKAGIAAGGNDFITKPFDAKNLMARVERWVRQKQV
jgi:two-component system, OmpR family, response regulator